MQDNTCVHSDTDFLWRNDVNAQIIHHYVQS